MILTLITISTTILGFYSVFPQFKKNYNSNDYSIFSFNFLYFTQFLFIFWLVYSLKLELKLLFFQMLLLFLSYLWYLLKKLNSLNIKNKLKYFFPYLIIPFIYYLSLNIISTIAIILSLISAVLLLISITKNNNHNNISLVFIMILVYQTFAYSIYGYLTNSNAVLYNNFLLCLIYLIIFIYINLKRKKFKKINY